MENAPLRDNLLFRRMDDAEIRDCLTSLSARTKRYKKDALILHAGEKADRMGIVLQGSVTVESNDIWGNCTILSHVDAGGFFRRCGNGLRCRTLQHGGTAWLVFSCSGVRG